jgi:glycosyltransferase involved in cell wall biosynthesis
MSPLVSIVIPTYNRSHTLGRAIQSVLNQTLKDFELIIVDDGSTDETNSVLGTFESSDQIKIILQPHAGSAAACNRGIRVARGRYIAIHGSDDEWAPENLTKAVEALEHAGPQVGVFYSDMWRIMPDGSSLYHHAPAQVRRGQLINEDTREFAVFGIGSGAAVIKKECYDTVGLFDELMPRFLDLELFIRLADKFDFLHHPEPLVRWTYGKGISSDHQAFAISKLYLLEKYRRRLKRHKRFLARQYLETALAFESIDDMPESFRLVSKAILADPSIFKEARAAFQIRDVTKFRRNVLRRLLVPTRSRVLRRLNSAAD